MDEDSRLQARLSFHQQLTSPRHATPKPLSSRGGDRRVETFNIKTKEERALEAKPFLEVMSTDIDQPGPQAQPTTVDDPSTPPDNDVHPSSSSQVTLPSTEVPASPLDSGQSFKTEANDERIASASVIRSSLTPPPSSQVPANGGGASHHLGYINSQRSGIFSPPATGLNSVKRDSVTGSDYVPPSPQQVVGASPDELRSFLQTCIAEHAKLKMETAHHKLQYNLLSLQADEDAKRAAVEHEMTRREVEALRDAEHSRYARRELTAASESAQTKYRQLKVAYDQVVKENESLNNRLKLAKKVIQQKDDDVISLTDERDLLLNRIRENREHFHQLCSPGGMFHTAMTPKTQSVASPAAQYKSTPRRTPRSGHKDAREHGQEPFDVLLKAATQENNSAPSTPITGYKPAPRMPSKHTRGVQSMSSLPSTPTPRSRGAHPGGLLPSVDLVPQSEPPYRHNRFVPETPDSYHRHGRRRSRESTISADDNEELARQALTSFASRGPHDPRISRRQHRVPEEQEEEGEEEEVFESQASQAASEMLRRDPRESFEVASSLGESRDVTPPPAPAEKSAKLQARLFAGLNKSGVAAPAVANEKRKFSGGSGGSGVQHPDRRDDRRSEIFASPTKKLRVAGGLRDPARVGLGIQYGREA